MARQFYNCWSTCVKLAWDVDRAAKTFFVDNLLAGGLPSMRSSVLACYGNFYAGVRYSASIEVRTLACVAVATGSNLRNLTTESGVDPRENVSGMRRAMLEAKCPVPPMDT